MPGFDGDFAGPRDIGVVAAAYPDMRFVAYHSGYETSVTEGPYDAASVAGVDTLVTAMQDNGLAPGSNVYAELGSTWRSVMTSPTEAAHVLAALLMWLGQHSVGTIRSGTLPRIIAAFRTFQSRERAENTLPALTDATRARSRPERRRAVPHDPSRSCAISPTTTVGAARAGRRPPIPTAPTAPGRCAILRLLRSRDGQPG